MNGAVALSLQIGPEMSFERFDPVTALADTEASDADIARLVGLYDLIAHELRGPLTAIVGFSERTLRGRMSLPPEAADALSVIHQQAMEMAFRIDLLVRASELDDPRATPIQSETVALDQLVDQEVILLHDRYPAVAVRRRGEAGTHVESEPHRIREILANLLDNAAKYGGGTVTVTTGRQANEVLIDVHDDGPGVPEELRSRIFERGFRTPDARRREPSGLGLGLFVAYQLTRQLEGALTCTGSGTSGTSFILRLPFSKPT